jgi:hypothetical protein
MNSLMRLVSKIVYNELKEIILKEKLNQNRNPEINPGCQKKIKLVLSC